MKKVLFTFLPLILTAQSVSFEEALQHTFDHNKDLKAKETSISLAKQKLKEADGFRWGEFTVTESICKTNRALQVFGSKLESREAELQDFGFVYIPPAGTYVGPMQPDSLDNPGFRNHFKTAFSYKVPIFTGFQIDAARKMAELQVKANRFKFNRDKNRLGIEVLKSYNGAVAAKYFIKALKKAKQTTLSFINMTRTLHDQGMIVKSDLLSAEARDAEVDSMIIDADNKYQLSLAYLRYLTGNDHITDVEDFKIIVSPETSLKKLQSEALKERNDVKWMNKNVETMKEKIRLDSSSFYPQVGASLEYAFNDNRPNNLSLKKDYLSIGFEISYKIFDGFRRNAVKEQALIEAKKSRYQFEHMQEGIKVDVEQKYLVLRAKTAVIQGKVKKRDLAEEISNQYTTMYKNGLVNISLLLMKDAELQKARADLIQAKYDQAVAAANLKFAVGNLFNKNTTHTPKDLK